MLLINFVRDRRKKLKALSEGDKKYFKLTAIVSGVLIFITLAAFGGRIYFSTQLKKLDSEIKRYEQQVLAYEAREEAFVVFANKLDTLVQIFQSRKNKQQAIDYFSQIFGPDVLVERISYQADDETVDFVVRSPSVFAMDEVIDILDSAETKQKFPTSQRSSLQRRDDGTYSVQIEVGLGDLEQG